MHGRRAAETGAILRRSRWPPANSPRTSASGSKSSSRRRRAQPIASAAGSARRLWRFAVFVSVIHLYAAVAGSPPFTGTPIIPTYTLRPLHVGLVLALIYVLFPMRSGCATASPRSIGSARPPASRSSATSSTRAPSSATGPSIPSRSISTSALLLIVLLLEATRRSTGWIMPVVSL